MSQNMFSVLEDQTDVPQQQKKTEKKPKVEEKPKTVTKKLVVGETPKKEEKPVTKAPAPKKEAPKEVKKEVKKDEAPKPSQDGFEQVSKSVRGGRPTQERVFKPRDTTPKVGAPKDGKVHTERTEKPERTERPERTDRPERTERVFKPRPKPTGESTHVAKEGEEEKPRPPRKNFKEHSNTTGTYTGKPKEGVSQKPGGRFHDHHQSGTGFKKNTVQKDGAGAHNWGKATDQLEVVSEKEEVVHTENKENATEAEPKVETKEEKRRKKKDEKKRLAKGKKEDKDSGKPRDELTREEVLGKPDPNAKTLDQYKQEQDEKRKAFATTSKVEEKKSEKKVEKKEEKKSAVVTFDMFKSPTAGSQEKKVPKEKFAPKTKKSTPPNIRDQNAFPTLK